MKNFNLATIPGDGIGPEVVTQGLRVLDAVAAKYSLTFTKTNYELGAAYWHKTKETLPESVMAELAKSDVILLGAVGDPTVPSGVLERGLLLKLRFAFEHYINLRPAKLFPGVTSPITNNKGIDFVVVREGTEGLYVGAGSIKDEGTNKELAIEESINTYKGVERVIRDAFNRAMARPRKKLTLVHKNNVLTRAGGLWTRVFNEVAKEFPEITTDYLHVDADHSYDQVYKDLKNYGSKMRGDKWAITVHDTNNPSDGDHPEIGSYRASVDWSKENGFDMVNFPVGCGTALIMPRIGL